MTAPLLDTCLVSHSLDELLGSGMLEQSPMRADCNYSSLHTSHHQPAYGRAGTTEILSETYMTTSLGPYKGLKEGVHTHKLRALYPQ